MVAAELTVCRCGLVPYRQALEWMRLLQQQRARGEVCDTLLVLQHPAVVTLGMSGGREDVLLPDELLVEQGIQCVETERGGRATLHAPGQMVAYPVMRLGEGDLHEYLWKIEAALLQALSGWGIAAQRSEAHPGMWVRGRKIAALGLAVREGVAYHGAALNVCNDLSLYRWIHPCGLDAGQVTSMQVELGEAVALQAVEEAFIQAFCEVFERKAIVRVEPVALPLS